MTQKTPKIVTSEPVRVVGKDREELDNAYGREKVDQPIAVWAGLVTGESNRIIHFLDKVITAGLPSEAWKIPLSMVGDERSEAAQDKGKR